MVDQLITATEAGLLYCFEPVVEGYIDAAGAPHLSPRAPHPLIAAQLREARDKPHDDSPLFQLIHDMPRPAEVDHTKTDIFRERFDYSRKYKDRLTQARLGDEAGAVDSYETAVAKAAAAMVASGELFGALASSLQTVLIGFLLAASVGIALGIQPDEMPELWVH